MDLHDHLPIDWTGPSRGRHTSTSHGWYGCLRMSTRLPRKESLEYRNVSTLGTSCVGVGRVAAFLLYHMVPGTLFAGGSKVPGHRGMFGPSPARALPSQSPSVCAPRWSTGSSLRLLYRHSERLRAGAAARAPRVRSPPPLLHPSASLTFIEVSGTAHAADAALLVCRRASTH